MSAAAIVRNDPAHWVDICSLDEIAPDTGVCALLDGRQIAIVHAAGGVYALDNFDPFAKVHVISRGIVGDRKGRAKIASPIYKHSFDLETGRCLDDPQVALDTFPVRVRNGRVEIALT
jgi:nitrite reductase (NADH) small subunit